MKGRWAWKEVQTYQLARKHKPCVLLQNDNELEESG